MMFIDSYQIYQMYIVQVIHLYQLIHNLDDPNVTESNSRNSLQSETKVKQRVPILVIHIDPTIHRFSMQFLFTLEKNNLSLNVISIIIQSRLYLQDWFLVFYYCLYIRKMNRLFGAKKEPAKPEPLTKEEQKPDTQLEDQKQKPSLTDQQARLENRVRELSESVTKLDNEAKELLEKSKKSKGSAKQMYKQRCLMVLKKRKLYDNQLKNAMNQQMTLDQVAFTSQSIQNTIQMGDMMKDCVQSQKGMMDGLDFDKLDDLRDEMEEVKYESDYLNQMLNRDYDIDVDEDQLDDEIGQLQRELKAQKQLKKKEQKQVQNAEMV